MKKIKFIFTFLLYSVFVQSFVFGQTTEVSFRRLSPPGGFTRYGIQSIIQDNLGYMWMATRQGLIRYDSKNTRWFMPLPNDSTSLPSENINSVFSDNNNQVWVTTGKGLCRFNRQTQGFEPIKYVYEDGSKAQEVVLSILQTSRDQFLVIDDLSFGILDVENKQLNRIAKNQIESPRVLFEDDSDKIWVGTAAGDVFCYFPSSNSVKKIVSANSMISCIYSENDKVWIGTEEGGARIYNLDGNLIEEVPLKSNSEVSKFELVRKIKRDSYGRLWYGTDDGLFVDSGDGLNWLNPDEYPGIPHNSIFHIYEDNNYILWIGTWNGGLTMLHHSDNSFETFRHSSTSNSISNNVVSSFLQVSKNELLIGTEVGGLNSFNLKTKKFDVIELDEKNQIRNIKALCKDKYGGIWAGTFRKGLWYKAPGMSEYKVFDYGVDDGKHISSISVYALCAVDSGVWIGTYRGGLNFYSFKTKSIRRCFLNNPQGIPMSQINVSSILTDNKSNLWLSTFDSFLYRIHLPSGNVTKIENDNLETTHENNTVYHLWQRSTGDIWMGTKNNGVLIYHPDSTTFEHFDAGGFLKQNDVYGIIEDSERRIWISSNNGLILYNPEDLSKRQFVYSDGIQSNIFSAKAVFKDDQGFLYFGGSNGFTRINPSNISVNLKKPYSIIHSLTTKNNKSIFPGYAIKEEIVPVHLNPNETTFRINFSADNYLMPEKNKYKYRLVNYYDDWVDSGNEGSVLFTSLKAGEYFFEVKACNNDGIWNDSPTTMTIIIKEKWYKTNLAYIFYLLLFAVIIYSISRFYFERLKLKRAILFEKNQRENEEQINEMKLKFFTNISHEFRTPLTLISWPLKRLANADNISNKQRKELNIAQSNTNRLLQLINQIIDLRKLEGGKDKLDISKVDVVQLIKNMLQGFLGEVKTREIEVVFDCPYSSIEIDADLQKLDTALYNILSNAFKYVPSGGQIKLSVDKKLISTPHSYAHQISFGEIYTDDFIQISIEDTGSGIDKDDLSKIFDRFEQGKNKEHSVPQKIESGGIGLSVCKEFTLLHRGKITVESNLGKGSRFVLLLPRKQKAQKILFESHKNVLNLSESKLTTVEPKTEVSLEARKQILVVEDNVDFRSFISDFLGNYYQVECATNGNEGLSIFKKRNIDLVVSDVMMPEMDGFEFCNIIKSQIETSHIPVILLTALASSENLITGLDKGADAYLTKPFDESILLKQIENLLEQRRRIHKNFTKQFISKKTIEVGGLDNFFLNRVRSVVENNITEEGFSLDKLAEELMMSRSNLHRKLKSLSGMSTSEFVNLIRIQYAVKIIKEENCRFNEVAFRLGFNTQAYFTRCFKKVYNVSPQEYFRNL